MTDEPTPFIDYWDAVDAAMLKFFGIDTCDAGIGEELIASAQDECQTPEEFARWFGEKYGLTYVTDWSALYGTSKVPAVISASPINTARALTPHWMQNIQDFDALEIHPCTLVGDSAWGPIVEQCEPDYAQFWTVFGHFRTGGVDAFEDFPTEAEALAFHDRLIAAWPHLAEREG